MCGYVHMNAVAHGGQRVSDPLELGLQVAVSHPMWALGTKLTASARAINVLNH